MEAPIRTDNATYEMEFAFNNFINDLSRYIDHLVQGRWDKDIPKVNGWPVELNGRLEKSFNNLRLVSRAYEEETAVWHAISASLADWVAIMVTDNTGTITWLSSGAMQLILSWRNALELVFPGCDIENPLGDSMERWFGDRPMVHEANCSVLEVPLNKDFFLRLELKKLASNCGCPIGQIVYFAIVPSGIKNLIDSPIN